ncbi:MAG: M20 family metallopeptidase [Thermogemmatispora sp.]|uniref:M20 family metallopeptidase n=1 Tax=Thermogemmatispora sp. TaxID=1968838 RepID=UPI002629457D|nr:M20 family metallopeptidase [Thermogemmatispora sp.]MBX5456098.1 M20 family metallopeptidase [Thermogemmatispora sp.]
MAVTFSQAYLTALQHYEEEMLQRLALLVNIDSGTGQVEGVTRIMGYLRSWLEALGCSVTLHDGGQYGPHLVARLRGSRSGEGRRFLLVGHVDTVYAPGSALACPFRRDGELAFGPGVIDMKSGVIMALYSLRALLESHFADFGEICLVFNGDEEMGSPSSAPLLRKLARQADVGLVLEPTRSPEIITEARKGADRYLLEISGRAAHSGAEPHRGRSAVIELAHKIVAIDHLHTLLPGVTFNVTRLGSSELLNVVPEMARCWISVRAYTQEGLEAAAEALEQIAACSSVPGTRAYLTRTRGRVPYQATPQVRALVAVARLEAQALGLELVAEAKGGVSDANLLMQAGLPTLDSLGPVGGKMHVLREEFLRVPSLALRGALLAGLIRQLALQAPNSAGGEDAPAGS